MDNTEWAANAGANGPKQGGRSADDPAGEAEEDPSFQTFSGDGEAAASAGTAAAAPFKFHGQEVQTVTKKGEIWFVAADVCGILGYANTSKTVAALDGDEKGITKSRTPGGAQQMLVVNEAGLVTLVMNSEKPRAKAFRRWVTDDVLPAIRKTGRYKMSATDRAGRLYPPGSDTPFAYSLPGPGEFIVMAEPNQPIHVRRFALTGPATEMAVSEAMLMSTTLLNTLDYWDRVEMLRSIKLEGEDSRHAQDGLAYSIRHGQSLAREHLHRHLLLAAGTVVRATPQDRAGDDLSAEHLATLEANADANDIYWSPQFEDRDADAASAESTAVVPFGFQGRDVRTVHKEGKIWFVASDISQVLEYADTSAMIERLDEDEKAYSPVQTASGVQSQRVISESGIYHLVWKSGKPEAKAFRRWVTNDVLPAIRRTGEYFVGAAADADTTFQAVIPGYGPYVVVMKPGRRAEVRLFKVEDMETEWAVRQAQLMASVLLTTATYWQRTVDFRAMGHEPEVGAFTLTGLEYSIRHGGSVARNHLSISLAPQRAA